MIKYRKKEIEKLTKEIYTKIFLIEYKETRDRENEDYFGDEIVHEDVFNKSLEAATEFYVRFDKKIDHQLEEYTFFEEEDEKDAKRRWNKAKKEHGLNEGDDEEV